MPGLPRDGRPDADWPFDDPAALEGTEAERLAKFREVRDQIDARLRRTWLGAGYGLSGPVNY